jgi:hypothetical protein
MTRRLTALGSKCLDRNAGKRNSRKTLSRQRKLAGFRFLTGMTVRLTALGSKCLDRNPGKRNSRKTWSRQRKLAGLRFLTGMTRRLTALGSYALRVFRSASTDWSGRVL